MRRAYHDDIPVLLAMMSDFYAESDYVLARDLAEAAFVELLSDERMGYIWLIEEEAADVGYIVVTLRFGMEYGGMMACLDDLYVIPQSRNRGLSTAALIEVRDFCKSLGIRAITVEVGFSNLAAQSVYRRLGMVEATDRQLLALALARPTHVV